MTGVKKIFVSAAIAVMMMPGMLSAQLRFENQDVSIISKLPTQYTGYVIHGSTGSTTVYYRVSAVVVGVGETKSNVITVADANAVRSSTNIVQLGWLPVEGATSYNIYRSTVSASTYFFLLRNVDKTILYYKDTGAANTSAYSAPNPRGGNLAVENNATVGGNLTVTGTFSVPSQDAIASRLTAAEAKSSTAAYLGNVQTFTAAQTMSGPLTLSGSSLTVNSTTSSGAALFRSNYLAPYISSITVRAYDSLGSQFVNNGSGYGETIINNIGIADYRAGISLRYNDTEGFRMDGVGAVTIPGSAFSVGGSTLVVSGGKVGVGTVSPQTKLHVEGTMTATAANIGGVASLSAVGGAFSIVTSTNNPGMTVGNGVISYDGTDTIVTYNSTGTTSFTPPTGVTKVRVLVVAGGGGGGSAIAGGGGAGGLLTSTSFPISGAVTVTVGAGGNGAASGSSANGVNGTDSVFSSLIAIGGGAGAASANAAGNGGSGGGARSGTVGTGTAGQGFAGGEDSATNGTSGGGGGAGAIGATAVGSASGAGGVGVSNNITGSAIFYAGGGGGGGYVQGLTTAGAGGDGGGGAGGVAAAGTNGTNNKGGGGGGGGYSNAGPINYAGGAGGSGIVIVRFATAYDTLTVNDKFRVHNNGKLSIGTTTANNSLTVANSGVNGVAIDLRSDDTNLNGNAFSAARLLADFSSTSYTDSRLYLQTATGDNAWKTGLTVKDGNVGIGTTTPSYPLTLGVAGNVFGVENTASFWAKNSGAVSEMWMRPRGNDNVMYTNFGSAGWNVRNNSSASVMFMKDSGNVGINVTDPSETLEVAGGIASYSRTMAQLLAIPPSQVGVQYFCNNCTPAKMVVSTGTAAGNFADIMGGTFQ